MRFQYKYLMSETFRGLLAGALVLFSCIAPQLVAGQDIGETVVERVEYYSQCTTNRADTTFDRAHRVAFYVFPMFNGAVLSATVTQKSNSFTLENEGNGTFTNSPDLTAAAPGGSYEFNVATVDEGTKVLKVALPAVPNGIAPLRLANFPASQSIDASQDFTFTWDKAPKLNTHDYLLFEIFQTNGTTVFDSGQLAISQTNVLIPAGTLQPNTTYRAYIYFRHFFSLQNKKLPESAATEVVATRFGITTLNPAGVFQFGPNPVVANVQDGTASMEVVRTQGSQGDVTVDYYSSDRTAVAGTNYTAVASTLDFPDGVTNQTITVPLLNDGATNGPLSLLLTLTNASGGAGLVIRPHATVTILDSSNLPAPALYGYLLGRVQFYDQTATNPPSQSNECDAARFYTSIRPIFPGVVTNASLQMRKASITLTNDHDYVECAAEFPSIAALNKAFPPGKYTLNYSTTSGGSFSPSLTMVTEKQFPVPYVTNGIALNSVDPSMPLTLGWNAFTGATSNDFVIVSVRDPSHEYVFRTPDEFEPGALLGTTGSVTIPAGTMQSGGEYLVNVIFSKMIDSPEAFPGIRAGVASVHTTAFNIQTISASPAVAPQVAPAASDADCPCHGGSREPFPAVYRRDF